MYYWDGLVLTFFCNCFYSLNLLLLFCSSRIHWRLIFGKIIRCSTLSLEVDYFIYFKFTPVFFHWMYNGCSFKVGLSPSKKNCVVYFIESPLKMMKNTFYFILKALFILKIFKFLLSLFGHVEKTAWLER